MGHSFGPFDGLELDLEHLERPLNITMHPLSTYRPEEHEKEKASNAYLMSLIMFIVGLPLPIVNLIATVVFWLGYRRSSFYVRWHCTQALLLQLSLFFVNSYGFWWTMSILFGDESLSNAYLAYLFTAILFNLSELITTIYTTVETRKGKNIRWWFYAALTDRLCQPRASHNFMTQ